MELQVTFCTVSHNLQSHSYENGADTLGIGKEPQICSEVHRFFMSTSHALLMDRGPQRLSVTSAQDEGEE